MKSELNNHEELHHEHCHEGHGCCHNPSHHGEERKTIIRIIIGAVFFVLALVISHAPVKLVLFIASYLIAGIDVLCLAVKNICHGRALDENFLMGIATVGAFLTANYAEGVAVMLFYQAGELFQSRAVNKSRSSIAELMDIHPDYANVLRDGKPQRVNPETVEIGEIIIIKPGEKVPLDGVVIEGHSVLDTSALTGETVPAEVETGSEILSGCVNMNGVLSVRVTKSFGESTASKILDLVENASSKKSRSEKFITVFARYYTPAVTAFAALLAIVIPLVVPGAAFKDWVYRALTFLVISCPCALVISVPLSFYCGIGAASSKGILVKGSNFLEALARTEIVVFDKTGTLTVGEFSVCEIKATDIEKEELLRLAALAEGYSSHPISQSIKNAYGMEADLSLVSNSEEIPGCGVTATIENRSVAVGNERMLGRLGLAAPGELSLTGTVVYIAVDGKYAGCITIADAVKDDAKSAITELKKEGVKNIVMLTGDRADAAQSVASSLGMDSFFAELLPADKVEKVEILLAEKSSKGKLVFAGDGINDAPVLARADIGAAMGGIGSDAAIEAADVVLMTDEPSKLAEAIKLSKRTMSIVGQNIIFSLGIKLIVLVLGAMGIATMWGAVFADVGVSFLAILNAVRILKRK